MECNIFRHQSNIKLKYTQMEIKINRINQLPRRLVLLLDYFDSGTTWT